MNDNALPSIDIAVLLSHEIENEGYSPDLVPDDPGLAGLLTDFGSGLKASVAVEHEVDLLLAQDARLDIEMEDAMLRGADKGMEYWLGYPFKMPDPVDLLREELKMIPDTDGRLAWAAIASVGVDENQKRDMESIRLRRDAADRIDRMLSRLEVGEVNASDKLAEEFFELMMQAEIDFSVAYYGLASAEREGLENVAEKGTDFALLAGKRAASNRKGKEQDTEFTRRLRELIDSSDRDKERDEDEDDAAGGHMRTDRTDS